MAAVTSTAYWRGTNCARAGCVTQKQIARLAAQIARRTPLQRLFSIVGVACPQRFLRRAIGALPEATVRRFPYCGPRKLARGRGSASDRVPEFSLRVF